MAAPTGSRNDEICYIVELPEKTSCLEFFTSLYAQAHPDRAVPKTAHLTTDAAQQQTLSLTQE